MQQAFLVLGHQTETEAENTHNKQSKLLWPVNLLFQLGNVKSINKTSKQRVGRRSGFVT